MKMRVKSAWRVWVALCVHGAALGGVSGVHAQALTPAAALERAFLANPDVRVADLNVEQARTQLRAAQGARVPTFVAGANAGYNERFNATARGVSTNNTRSLSGTAGLRYTSDWGTTMSVDVTTSSIWQTANIDLGTVTTVNIGPNYATNASVTLRQPLLRGAGEDGQLSTINAAAASLTQAERTREASASVLMRDVLSAYWELWYAERALALQREALAVAERQLAETKVRVETLGTAARTDMFRFATERSSILEAIESADATRRTRAFELGRLLGVTPSEAASLQLQDGAPVIATPVSAEIAIEAALGQAPELAALEQQVEAANARAAGARNAEKARLDVVSTLGAGTLWASNDMLTGWQLPGGRPALIGTIGLELELPMGENQADGNLASALASRSQAEAQLDVRKAQLRAEVASSHASLTSALSRVALAQDSVNNASAVVEGEQHRLSLGTATSSDVIIAQQTHREAVLRGLRTLVDAAVASARLRQATGQLLADNRALATLGASAGGTP